jgi:hypothetical protein
MSKDLTGKTPQGTDEKLDLILTTVLSMTVRVDSIDSRLHRVEEGQQRLEDGQRRLELGQEVLRSEVEALSRSVKHRFLILSGQVQASYNTLEKRVTVLEADSNTPNCQT